MLILWILVIRGVSSVEDIGKERMERELLKKEKDIFQDIRQRLTKLEKSIDSRKCNGYPTHGQTGTTIPGTTYVRWGRSSCGTKEARLVYAGYTGGSHYSHYGGAAEFICLPKKPDLGLYLKGMQGGGLIYGAEYQPNQNSFFHQSLNEQEVPCAVCDVTGRTRYIMIPGKKKCQKGWTIEYNGYLMSGHYTHQSATEYICVDRNAKKVGYSTNHNGKLLYMVEAQCGSLPCPPYVNNREFTCVVCTK